MIVKAPVNSLRAAKLQCKYGAKEIYVGLQNKHLNKISFSGRGNIKVDKKDTYSNLKNAKELEEIVEFCHEKNVKVSFAANCPALTDSMQNGYKEYVLEACETGIDSIIVGDLSSLIFIHSFLPSNIKICASVFFEVYNKGCINMLQSLNVDEVFLPHHLLLEELKEMSKCNMKIGVFSNYGCSFSNGRCALVHRWGEDLDLGIPCRAEYIIKDSKNNLISKENIFDFGVDCCLCTIKEMMEMGINSIKLIDRATPVEQVIPFTKVYSEAIHMLEKGESIEEVKRMAHKTVPWWKEQFCKSQKCRYLQNCYSQYYI